MHGQMCTHTEAASDFVGATYSAASSDTAADTCRFAASYSSTPTVGNSNSE
jgi:hypothetical protein